MPKDLQLKLFPRLGPEAQLQLLMIIPDVELVSLIDDAVFSKAVRIPLGEIRRISYETPRSTMDSGSELSALGIRSVRPDAFINLVSAIWRAYQRLNLTTELEWRVRGDSAKSLYEALVAFVRNRGPVESVMELILSSAGITGAVCEDLHVPLKACERIRQSRCRSRSLEIGLQSYAV